MTDLILLPLAARVFDAGTLGDLPGAYARNEAEEASLAASRPRDRRVSMVGSGYRALIEGRQVALVNLSLSGAQLRGPMRLLPDQPAIVKIGWPKDDLLCTAIARVRWVQFEPDPSSETGLYRVGLAFETWDVRGLKELMRRR